MSRHHHDPTHPHAHLHGHQHAHPYRAAPAHGFFPALRQAAGAACQWRLLLVWAVLLLAPTLVATLPVWQMLGSSLDQSVQAGALAQALDMTAIADLLQASKRYTPAIGNGALVAFLLTLLLSPLLTGMVIGAARAPIALGFSALLAEGMREYGRLLRMLAWSLVPLGLASVLGGAAAAALRRSGENAVLESTAQHAALAGTLALALLLLLANASVDAGRAVLGADRRRTSAVLAWREGAALLLRRPREVLGSYCLITLAGLLLAALVALVRVRVAPVDGLPFAAAFVLTQLGVMALAWMRAARLFALIAVARR